MDLSGLNMDQFLRPQGGQQQPAAPGRGSPIGANEGNEMEFQQIQQPQPLILQQTGANSPRNDQAAQRENEAIHQLLNTPRRNAQQDGNGALATPRGSDQSQADFII